MLLVFNFPQYYKLWFWSYDIYVIDLALCLHIDRGKKKENKQDFLNQNIEVHYESLSD